MRNSEARRKAATRAERNQRREPATRTRGEQREENRRRTAKRTSGRDIREDTERANCKCVCWELEIRRDHGKETDGEEDGRREEEEEDGEKERREGAGLVRSRSREVSPHEACERDQSVSPGFLPAQKIGWFGGSFAEIEFFGQAKTPFLPFRAGLYGRAGRRPVGPVKIGGFPGPERVLLRVRHRVRYRFLEALGVSALRERNISFL